MPSNSPRLRVLFINRSYWPDTEATGQLLTELCEDLAATGDFDVHVLCGQPNHVSLVNETDPLNGTTHNGVTIHRVQHSQFSKKRTTGKLLNLMSFTLAAWNKSLKLPKFDVVVTETDPFFLGLLGRRIQLKTGARFVAYLQDLYPDVAVAVGKARNSRPIQMLRRRLFDAYAGADRVVVLSRDMQERCVEHGIPAAKIETIANWADVDSLRPVRHENIFRKEQGLEKSFVVMYSGNMGLPHLMTPFIDVAEALQEHDDIQFCFVGGGVQKPELEELARKKGLKNVRFLPYQPKSLLSHSLSAADVQLVSVKQDVIACLMPSKVYGILAAGCPVVAIVPPESELGELIHDNRFGHAVAPQSPELVPALTRAILDLRERPDPDLENRARQFVKAQASRGSQVTRFATLLRDVAGEASTFQMVPERPATSAL